MNKSFKKIISLLSMTENISGRKKFQKIVHILQHKGIDFSEKFKFHYYGPYSIELHLKIDALVKNGVIKEKKVNEWSYNYSLINKEYYEEDPELIEQTTFINYLNSQPSQVLELVSTVYYLLERNNNLSDNDAFLKSLRLKPKLESKIEDAKNVYSYIESNYNVTPINA